MEDILMTVPEYCTDHDEPMWHKSFIWMYDDGSYSECDESGNHFPSYEENEKSWRQYSQWVLEHGTDPLDEFIVKHSRKIKQVWRFIFNASLVGPVLLEARHAGRRYKHHEVPEHIRQYLNLTPRGKLADFATWAELVAVQPGITQANRLRVEIEYDQPRSGTVVARELRQAARRAIVAANKS